jgi:hypothetical protein
MATDPPVRLEQKDGYALFRAAGNMSLDRAVRMVTDAIVAAREASVGKLLVDIRGLTGLEPPGLGRRYLFVNEWARAAQSSVIIALVAERRMVDPNKYGVTVAHHAGLLADVFTTEEAALTWLRGRQ